MANDAASIDAAIEGVAARFSGRIGLAAVHLGTGEEIVLRERDLLPTASVIKLPILIELVAQAAEGGPGLDVRVALAEADRTYGTGVMKELSTGLGLTRRDVAVLMIVISDNTATNMAIDLVGGVGAVNERMRSFGLDTIDLHRKVPLPTRLDAGDALPDVRTFAEATALDLRRLMEMLALGRILEAAGRAEVLRILGRQQHLDQVPRYYDHDSFRDELGMPGPLTVACKTGFHPGTRADAGVVTMAGRDSFAYAVLNTGSRDTSMSAEAEGAIVNGIIGRLLLEHWWPADAGPLPVLDSPSWRDWWSTGLPDTFVGQVP